MWDDGPAAVTSPRTSMAGMRQNLTDEQLDADQAGVDRPARAQPVLLGRRTRARRSHGLRRRLGGLRLAGRLRHSCARRTCRSPTPIPRKAATRGSACTASARARQNLDLPMSSSTRSSPTRPATTWSTSSTTARQPGRHGRHHRPELKEAFSIDDPTILERTNFTPNLTAEQRDAWTAMWVEVKAS